MAIFILMIATAFNFAILRHKLQLFRFADTFFDVLVMVVLSYLFKGSFDGMAVAMGSSALISVYLLFNPIVFVKNTELVIANVKKGGIITLVLFLITAISYGIFTALL